MANGEGAVPRVLGAEDPLRWQPWTCRGHQASDRVGSLPRWVMSPPVPESALLALRRAQSQNDLYWKGVTDVRNPPPSKKCWGLAGIYGSQVHQWSNKGQTEVLEERCRVIDRKVKSSISKTSPETLTGGQRGPHRWRGTQVLRAAVKEQQERVMFTWQILPDTSRIVEKKDWYPWSHSGMRMRDLGRLALDWHVG